MTAGRKKGQTPRDFKKHHRTFYESAKKRKNIEDDSDMLLEEKIFENPSHPP